jgi:predicted house-cleaning noncanonical NTP pyrophosphatase (MazG superfamily)
VVHRRFYFNKMIRDHLPQMMQNTGINVVGHTMNEDEYVQRLKVKLVEEADELRTALTPKDVAEEIGDVLEVLKALAEHHHLDMSQVVALAEQKTAEKGGFSNPLCIDYIEIPENHPMLDYYIQRPHSYPEQDSVLAPGWCRSSKRRPEASQLVY